MNSERNGVELNDMVIDIAEMIITIVKFSKNCTLICTSFLSAIWEICWDSSKSFCFCKSASHFLCLEMTLSFFGLSILCCKILLKFELTSKGNSNGKKHHQAFEHNDGCTFSLLDIGTLVPSASGTTPQLNALVSDVPTCLDMAKAIRKDQRQIRECRVRANKVFFTGISKLPAVPPNGLLQSITPL